MSLTKPFSSHDTAWQRSDYICLQDKLLQEQQAREWLEREVKAAAAHRAVLQDAAKRAALQWVRSVPDAHIVSSISAQLAYISQSALLTAPRAIWITPFSGPIL